MILLGGLAAKVIVVENGATLQRCELSLYLTNPTHPQSSNAIYDLANLFGCVFWPELIFFRHGTPSVCPDTSQFQVALPGGGRLVKIAHPGTWLWQHLWQHLAPAKSGPARIATAASAAGPSPCGVQCFTGPALGVFFGARVTRQPQTTNANRTATKIPSSRLSTMLFSASGRSASVRGAGTPSPFGSTTQPSMLRFRTIARHVAGQGAGAVRCRGREDAVYHSVDRTACNKFLAKIASDLRSAYDQNGHSIEAWPGRPQLPATRSAGCAGSHTRPLTLC
jgi:hypothetical protein